MFAIFAGQGEVCSAGRGSFLKGNARRKFLPRLAAVDLRRSWSAMVSIRRRIWDRSSRRQHMGLKCSATLRAGKAEGAELLCGGQKLARRRPR